MTFSPDLLPQSGLPLLRDLIHERVGLFYDDGRSDILSDRLAPLVVDRGFRSFLDFYFLLKYDESGAPDAWRDVVDALAVQETYFWREMDQMHALVQTVLPEILQARPMQPIRIWSAPCATGEEPLTIAMVLEEAGWFQRAAIEIHASDGSQAAIARARVGRYRERSFRALPDDLRQKYFEPQDGQHVPIPRLRARVRSWSVVNLLAADEVRGHAACDVIFCRNAFIYFSTDAIRRVVDIFAGAMRRPGYLFVGAAESLLTITNRFTLRDVNRAFVYMTRQS